MLRKTISALIERIEFRINNIVDRVDSKIRGYERRIAKRLGGFVAIGIGVVFLVISLLFYLADILNIIVASAIIGLVMIILGFFLRKK